MPNELKPGENRAVAAVAVARCSPCGRTVTK